jgi:hypothetical protein
MIAIARFIMRGPWQATLVVALLALISLVPILGVLSVLSGAAVALVTLRMGAQRGLTVLCGAGLLLGLVMFLVQGQVGLAVAVFFGLLLWLPLWLLAQLLRKTQSWSLTLDVAAMIGIAGVLAAYGIFADPAHFWQQVLTNVIDAMANQGGIGQLDAIRTQLPQIATWMTGFLSGAVVLGLISSLMLGRWWQAMLYNPGGFRQEFLALRQSRAASVIALAIVVLGLAGSGAVAGIAKDSAVVVVVIYSVFGLALTHAIVAMTGASIGWLIGLYVVAFILLPHVMIVLSVMGLADSFLDFRSRFKPTVKPSGGNHDPN